jgi:hypothetical protein
MDVIKIVEETLNQPPVVYNSESQTLKGWVLFCLRDRGFKISASPKADFILETRRGKFYFNITDQQAQPTTDTGWIVHDAATGKVQVIAANLIQE